MHLGQSERDEEDAGPSEPEVDSNTHNLTGRELEGEQLWSVLVAMGAATDVSSIHHMDIIMTERLQIGRFFELLLFFSKKPAFFSLACVVKSSEISCQRLHLFAQDSVHKDRLLDQRYYSWLS